MKVQILMRVLFIVLLFSTLVGCKEETTVPSVSTSSVENVQSGTALCGGQVKDDGGEDVQSRGVCWSTQDRPTTADGKTVDGKGSGDFTSEITGLNSATVYYVRAYATNAVGTAYGKTVTFTTSASLATVSTTSVSLITSSSAVCGGNISFDGGSAISARGVCWSTSPSPTVSNSKTSNGFGSGSFSSTIDGLTASTKYYVRAYATNAIGTAYGVETSFTTISDVPGGVDNDNLLLGNPSDAVNNVLSPNNYLMVKSQYVLSYNNSKRTMNWTSWHLYSGDVGSTPRQDDFRADYTLPSSWYKVTETDFMYSTYGFDRGHMCPSADRTSSVTNNSATFLMTNMIPQAPNNNQQTWADLENYCRNLIDNGNELYIIGGPYGEGGTSAKGTFTVLSSGVVVPSKTWKIIVVLPNGNNDLNRITTSTRVIAVVMPNTQACSSYSWTYYRVSVDSIETLTGYNFLSNVPTSIQDVIEAKVDNL
jgi:endonuclease G